MGRILWLLLGVIHAINSQASEQLLARHGVHEKVKQIRDDIKKTQQNRVNKQIGDLMNDTGISDDTSKDEAEKTTPAPNTSAQDAKIQDVTDRAKALVGSDKPDTEEEEKALESALRDAKIQDVADRAKALVGGDEASSSDQVAQAESDLADIEDQLAMDKMQDVADRAKAISVHQPDMEDEGELEKLEQEEAHAVEPIKKQMIQEEDKAGCIATKMKKIADVTDRAKALKIATMQSQLSNDQLSADEDELAKLECELDDDKKADEGLKQAQELPDPGLIEEKAVDQAEANNLEGAMKAAETLTDEQIKQEECDKLAAMSGFISGGDGLVSENMSPELKKRMQKLQSQLSSAVTTKEKMAILGAAAEQSAQQAKTQLESATEDGKDLKQKIHAANVLTDQANANVAKTDEDLKTSQNKMKVLGEKMKEKAADIRKSKVVQSMANQSAKLKAQAATKAHVQSKLDAAAAPSMISYLQSKASAVFMSLPGIHLPGTKPAEPAKEEKKAGTPPDPASQMEDAVDGMKSDAEAAKIVARKAAQKMSNAKKEADQLADVAEAAKKKLDVHSKVAKKAKAELKQSLEDANEATQDLGNVKKAIADAATSAQASKVEQDMLKSLIQKQIDLGCDIAEAKQAKKTLKEAEMELPPPQELEKQAKKEDSDAAACSDMAVEIEEAQKAETKDKAKQDCIDAQLKKNRETLGNENEDPCAEPAPACMCCDELYGHHEEHAKLKDKEDEAKKADKKLEATENAKKQEDVVAEIAASNPELVTPPSPMPQLTPAPAEKPTEVKPDSKESTTTTTAKPS